MAARDDMAAYMRHYRARKRAEKDAAGGTLSKAAGSQRSAAPVIDTALPRDKIQNASAGELASFRAKVAAIGPGAVITKTGDRLDVVTSEAFEARSPVPARSREWTVVRPATPASMYAIGGKPGRGLVPQGYGYPAPPDIAAASTFTKWCANTETMLAALAAKADAQERRIAALEAAQADRRANALAVAQALAGLFSFAVNR